jgi:hypothetical protein
LIYESGEGPARVVRRQFVQMYRNDAPCPLHPRETESPSKAGRGACAGSNRCRRRPTPTRSIPMPGTFSMGAYRPMCRRFRPDTEVPPGWCSRKFAHPPDKPQKGGSFDNPRRNAEGCRFASFFFTGSIASVRAACLRRSQDRGSHKIEFSFLNANLMAPAGHWRIFESTRQSN